MHTTTHANLFQQLGTTTVDGQSPAPPPRSPSSALLFTFLFCGGEGSPTEIDYSKKIGYPYSNLSRKPSLRTLEGFPAPLVKAPTSLWAAWGLPRNLFCFHECNMGARNSRARPRQLTLGNVFLGSLSLHFGGDFELRSMGILNGTDLPVRVVKNALPCVARTAARPRVRDAKREGGEGA